MGRLVDVDERLLLALREPGDPTNPLGPTWLEEAGRDVTALGGYAVLTLLVVLVVVYEIMGRRYGAAVAGRGGHARRSARQPPPEGPLRSPAARTGSTSRPRLDGELPQRPRDALGGGVPHARGAARAAGRCDGG